MMGMINHHRIEELEAQIKQCHAIITNLKSNLASLYVENTELKDILQKSLSKMIEHNIHDDFTETMSFIRQLLKRYEAKSNV